MQQVQAQSAARASTVTVAQIVDNSPLQQDVSRDFLIGSRAAWLEARARLAPGQRPVTHWVIDTDGSAASLRDALRAASDNPNCLLVSGTVGHGAAEQVTALLRDHPAGLAHAAPWLQSAIAPADDRTFAVFADPAQQIAHVLRTLNTMGVRQLTAIYASTADQSRHRDTVTRTALGAKLQTDDMVPDAETDLTALGRRVDAGSATMLLFIGGTPELLQFMQGLGRSKRQRYLVALADVNLQTVLQLGGARNNTSVVVTQAVPLATAGVPVVRAYRAALATYFDEAPTALSLAGFIAARYSQSVLGTVDGALNRQSVLAAFQRRAATDLGGHVVAPRGSGNASGYVTQTMLARDGRVVG